MTKDEEKEKTAKLKVAYEELISTLLKRARLTREDVYETAMKTWAGNNLDLLTKSEVEKYKKIGVI